MNNIVKLSAAGIFQSGMVMQRGKNLKIWGEANPGADVLVQIQGRKAVTTTDPEGKWLVELPPLTVSLNEKLEITAGEEKLTFDDIAIGEVFVASGQSNMEFLMRYEKNKADILDSCENGRIRFYDVPKVAYAGQNLDFDYSKVGIWRKANRDNLDFFSAVGYYFARALEETLDVPVGIIGCSWGGTVAASWMCRESAELLQRPEITQFAEGMKDIPEDGRRSYFSKSFLNDHGFSTWNGFYEFALPGTPTQEEFAEFFKQAQMEHGADFVSSVMPEQNPGCLFEYMVMTVAPFTVSGVLWYQGESDDNVDETVIRYFESMESVITDWRNVWQQPLLPFFVVQLPGFQSWLGTDNYHYTSIRADQMRVTEEIANTYLCSIGDCGEQFDIHPKNKKPVGERLALLAEKYLYHVDLCADAPLFKTAERSGNRIELVFLHGAGLHITGGQLNALEVRSAGEPVEYTTDIVGDKLIVEVSCSESAPITVNFAQAAWYQINLYNGAGLPAFPFKVNV